MIRFIIVTFLSLSSVLHATPETTSETPPSRSLLKLLVPAGLITTAAACATIVLKSQIEKRWIDDDRNTQPMSEENTLQKINSLNTEIVQFNDNSQADIKKTSNENPGNEALEMSSSKPEKSNKNKKLTPYAGSKSPLHRKPKKSCALKEQSPAIPAPLVNSRMPSPTRNQGSGLETATTSVPITPSRPERLNGSITGIAAQPPGMTEQAAIYEEKLKLMQKIEEQRNACSGLWPDDIEAQTCFMDAMAAAGKPFQNLPPHAQQYFRNFTPNDWRQQLDIYELIQGIAPHQYNALFAPQNGPIYFGKIKVIPMSNFGMRVLGIGDATLNDKQRFENYLNTKFPNSALALKCGNDQGHYTAFVPKVGFASAGFGGFDQTQALRTEFDQLRNQGFSQQEIDQMQQQMMVVDDAVKSPQDYLNTFNKSDPNLLEHYQPTLMLLDLNKLLDRAN